MAGRKAALNLQTAASPFTLGGLLAVLLFSTLGHFLTLDYPSGLLQAMLELPWPLE